MNTPTFTLDLEPTSPSAWPDWRPEYKDNVSFVATLKGTTASSEDVQFGSVTFTFHLGTPSQWGGVCMNYDGDPDTGTSYDLFIRKDDNPGGSGQTYTVTHPISVPGEKSNTAAQEVETGLGLTITGTGINSGTVSVRVNDYAAIGILSVSASFNYVDSGSGSSSSTGSLNDSISIPLDNNGNDIADGWENDAANDYNPWDDEETGPGDNKYHGDGYTVFEEYRGFMVKGNHSKDIPLKPTQIDVFVHSEFEADGYALGYASNLPDEVKLHLINYGEMNTPMTGTDNNPQWQLDPCVMNLRNVGDLLRVVKQRAIWINKNISTNATYTPENGDSRPTPFGISDNSVGRLIKSEPYRYFIIR